MNKIKEENIMKINRIKMELINKLVIRRIKGEIMWRNRKVEVKNREMYKWMRNIMTIMNIIIAIVIIIISIVIILIIIMTIHQNHQYYINNQLIARSLFLMIMIILQPNNPTFLYYYHLSCRLHS